MTVGAPWTEPRVSWRQTMSPVAASSARKKPSYVPTYTFRCQTAAAL
jgi:hypothetical protein